MTRQEVLRTCALAALLLASNALALSARGVRRRWTRPSWSRIFTPSSASITPAPCTPRASCSTQPSSRPRRRANLARRACSPAISRRRCAFRTRPAYRRSPTPIPSPARMGSRSSSRLPTAPRWISSRTASTAFPRPMRRSSTLPQGCRGERTRMRRSPRRSSSISQAHPNAVPFVTQQNPPPESFATTTYFGVNAFAFTDASGKKTIVRYRFVPEAGDKYLDAAAAASKGPNYLMEEIASGSPRRRSRSTGSRRSHKPATRRMTRRPRGPRIGSW